MVKRKSHSKGPSRATRPGQGPSAELWFYGVHTVRAALDNLERGCRRLLLTREANRQLGPRLDISLARRAQQPTRTIVDRDDIGRILPADAVHQGVALEVEPLPEPDLSELCAAAGERAVIVVLDQVTDPHNVGAVLRSAAAFGALAVIVPARHAPPVGGALAKAASGALERVALVRVTNLVRCLEALKGAGFWCIGLDARGDQALAELDLGPRLALVLGSEGTGLRRLTRTHCDLMTRLPTIAAFRNLNVSNAAAVALYEFARRMS